MPKNWKSGKFGENQKFLIAAFASALIATAKIFIFVGDAGH